MESVSDAALEEALSTLRDGPACDFLAKHHHKFYLKNNDPVLLDSAILSARRANEVCSSMNPHLRIYCFRAANYFNLRYRRSNQPCDADLDDALQYLEKAANTLLDNCHFRLFQAGRYGDFSKALYAFDEASKAWKEVGDQRKVAQTLCDIGTLHAAKFEKDWNKDLSLLDVSVDYIDKAIEAYGEASELRVELLGEKIRFLERRVEHNDTKKEQDYQAAIELAEWIISKCGDLEHAPKSMIANYQRWIGNPSLNLEAFKKVHGSLTLLWIWTEKLLDEYQTALRAAICQGTGLDCAIYAQEQLVVQALGSVKDEDQGEPQAEALDKLALLQQPRYEERRGKDDVLRVANSMSKAVDNTPDGHTQKLLKRLRHVAQWHANTHEKVGSDRQVEWL
ncbi:hypothetical protein BDW74DRAFT_172388 [Aspergillus multicolor]|uniref:uncharacterized protein n=1 Tax=Aspergillus multicolor TaxID=41759 RepID=UPI003CCCBD71